MTSTNRRLIEIVFADEPTLGELLIRKGIMTGELPIVRGPDGAYVRPCDFHEWFKKLCDNLEED